MKKLIDYARELKKELDAQDTDGQARPRFWVIGDYRWEPVPEGYSDEHMVCLPEEGSYDTLSQVFLENIKEEAEWRDIEVTKEFLEDLKEISCDVTLTDFLKKYFEDGAYLIPVTKEHYIIPNTFFITKQDAKDYLEKQAHNLSPDAHTYAMTALHSPKYRKLAELIMELE